MFLLLYFLVGSNILITYIAFFLQQFFHTFVVPYPSVTTFFNTGASLTNTPNSFGDRGRVVQVHVGERVLNGISRSLCLVMWNRRIKVMRDMSRSDLMMQEINQPEWIQFVVRTIDRVKCTLHKVMIIFRKMRNINISMLKPFFGDGRKKNLSKQMKKHRKGMGQKNVHGEINKNMKKNERNCSSFACHFGDIFYFDSEYLT